VEILLNGNWLIMEFNTMVIFLLMILWKSATQVAYLVEINPYGGILIIWTHTWNFIIGIYDLVAYQGRKLSAYYWNSQWEDYQLWIHFPNVAFGVLIFTLRQEVQLFISFMTWSYIKEPS
jgi:hypothetical protein